jgi:Domain of unknown function (DUF4166)
MTPPLYRRLLGQRFDELPGRVRELHDLTGTSVWAGRADVERGSSPASRLVATLFGLPLAGRNQALRVTFKPSRSREIWARKFNKTVFCSVQYERAGLLRERVGPTTFVFALEASAHGLALKLKSVRFLGLPLPRLLTPSVLTFETERSGRYQFDVEASLPFVGLIVRYVGWLENETSAATRREA